MYQALYRKYRPQTLDDVVGQEVIVKTLKNAFINNKLSHAYLFTGPRGTGKTSIAKILAKTVNCMNIKDYIPCNECVSCTQINNKQTTDIIEIDAASNNGVDEIREIRSKVNLVPANSRYKVYIIDEVHMLSTGAFNALLKTLEEPPSHAIFILATTDPYKIPATILSRCQRFDFKKIETGKIKQNLQKISSLEKIDIDDESLSELARLADGGMRDAISLLDQTNSYSNKINIDIVHEICGNISKKVISEIIIKLESNDIKYLMETIDSFNNNGKNLSKITEDIVLFLRDLLLYINIPDYFKEKSYFENIHLSEKRILEMIDNFNEAINAMKRSGNTKLLLELAVIKSLDKKTSVIEPLKKEANNFENNKMDQSNKKEIDLNITSKELDKDLARLIEVRVNNTLAGFKKSILPNIKSKLESISSLAFVCGYSNYVSLIIDGELRAASDEYLLFVYTSNHMSDLFNNSLLKIEEIIEKLFEKHYKCVSVDKKDWDLIKKDFNEKKKKYEIEEEKFNLEEMLNDTEEKIERLFKNIIEYEEEK